MGARHRRFQGGWNGRMATRMMWLFASWLLVVGAMVAVPTAAAAQTTGPATYVVDSTTTGGGDCDNAGSCTLRAAVDAANANPGSTVQIPAGTYVIDGQLALSAPMTIEGAAGQGADATVIDAAGGSRVFDVQATGVTITGVTITGGDVNQTGGGIRIGNGDELTLIDSRVTGNTAREGGGIDNSGTVAVITSTIDANNADRKGGGIRNNGVGTIDNSTITANTANQGGGLSSPGETAVTHATVVRNVATSSSSAGVDRNGGTLTIAYSVIAENFRSGGSEASDCSGTPDLVSLNLVSDAQGCNPVGPVLVDTAPGLGALADNGGPTPTIEVLDLNGAGDANPILDAIATTDCVFSTDQRGSARPIGAGCELGSFEVSPLEVAFDLSVDPLSYASIDDPATPGPEVEVGVITVPTADILEELVTRSEDPATEGPADAALRSIALRSIALRSIALRSIDPQSAALRSIALRSIALRSIALRSIALRSIALRSIALRSILVSDVPLETEGGWEAALAGTPLDGLPLQSITLEDIFEEGNGVEPTVTEELTLEDISIEASALRSIALRSIVLAGAALRSIEVIDPDTGELIPDTDPAALDQAWCDILSDVCPSEISAADLGGLDLLDVQLAGGDVDQVPMFDIPVASALRSIALRSIALRSIGIERSALRSIALRSIALRSIGGADHIGAIVDCSTFPEFCSTDEANTSTLGDALAAGAVLESATLQTLGDLDDDLLEGISLGDLLLAFLPPDGIQWESINLDGALLQNLPAIDDRQPVFEYVATVEVTGGPGDLDLTVTLPTGFAAARGDGDPSATFDGAPVDAVDDSLSQVQFLIDNVPNGIHELRIPARAGLTTGGPFTAVGQVIGSVGGEIVSSPPIDMVDVWVVEAFEADSPGSPIPLLADGELQLAHISRADDVDLYAFTVPPGAAGARARIRLSNIPAGVDYDLTVYQSEPTPLRGAATQTLESLGDIGYDLDPSDDVYETDLAGDIPLDVTGDRGISGFTVRDISTKRSQEDEEVATGPLEAGATYYVAVSSYLEGLSADPYGLRVQLQDAPVLPDCAGPRALPTGSALAQQPIGPDVNTLYITNTRWLAADLATTAGGTTLQEITDAIVATAGINGVVPALVPVDAYDGIDALYTTWATTGRCDVDARNAIVSAIGDIIDGISATNTIENIVIVGGDGVVPQAAVDDLTEFSNEDTFALETIEGNQNNEIAAALGASKLLSDDPYATAAGIAIRNGDHELFVQETVIGRLVESGEQILSQLTNFVTYGGELDPATLGDGTPQPGGTTPGNATSTVTGYDFLTDGAEALAAEFAAAGTVDTSLISETWDDVALLNLLAGADNTFLSVNAHYDFESLLPAAFDGTPFTADDLVTTDDFTGAAGIGVPNFTAIVTAGCHAGLSMHDVQLGFSTPDWAETFASGNNNVFAAHTTYGFGDTEAVAYSERLIEIFGRNLAALTNGDPGAPASIGAALRDAKQEYLGTTLVLTPYDEKILQSMTFYGMPMFVVGSDPAVAPLVAPQAAIEVDDGITVGEPDASGVREVAVELTPTVGASGPGNLNLVSTGIGEYYEVDGKTVGAQYRALQPLVDIPLPDSGTPAAGFLITDLTATDLASFTPYYLQPTLDSSANETYIEPADGSFPASLQRVSTQSNGQQRLLLAAGQFQDGLDGGLDVQRIFPAIGGDLYPENGVVVDEPIFTRVIGRSGEFESVVQFEIETSSPVQRVYVLFKEQSEINGVAWRGLDLFNVVGTNTWLGAAPVSEPEAVVEFFAQMVGLDNRVRITDNKVDNFLATLPDEAGDLTIELTGADLIGGYYNGPVTATVIDSTLPESLELSVDSQPFLPGASVEIADEGGHVVLARDDAGGREFVFFVIDSIAPDLSADASPTGGVVSGDVTVTASATDVGQAGVASITYSATGAEVIAETTVDGDQVSFDVTTDGDTTVTMFATDVAGNVSAVQTIDISIDKTAPTVSAAVFDPTPAPASGWYTSDVTVRVTGTDAGSGITGLTVDGTVTPVDPAAASASVDEVITAEGETTVSFSAVDDGGNTDSGSITVSIDKTAPTLTVTPGATGSPFVDGPVTVDIVATDATSGLATITYSATGAQTIASTEVATTTASVPITTDGVTEVSVFATDVAGNTTTVETVTVSIDRAGPSASAAIISPATAPASGWYAGDVTIRVSATDALSGVAVLTIGGVDTNVGPSGSESVDTVISDEGLTTVTFSATDAVGNVSSTGSIDVQIDASAPTVDTLTVDTTDPANDTNGNGLFDLGESVSVTYACSDAASGIASCELSLDGALIDSSASGGTVTVATSAIGDNVLSVDATDVAGNSGSDTATVLVPFGICLDYDPTQAKNIGSNYTVQFELCDLDGNNLSGRRITLTAIFIDGTFEPGPNDSGNANSQFEARYSNGRKRYTYNLDTSGFEVIGPGLHYLWFEITLQNGDSGGVVAAPFTLN